MQAVMTNARDRATGAMAGVYMYFGLSLLLTMVTTLFLNSTGITGLIVQSKIVLYTLMFAPLGIVLVLGHPMSDISIYYLLAAKSLCHSSLLNKLSQCYLYEIRLQ